MSKSPVVHSDPEILEGTRVPLQNLINDLEGRCSLGECLEDIALATRHQAIESLEEARALLTKAAA